jgi:2-hydroxychromene-2-carboxylate isomerase
VTPAFGITWDYRCPFARIAHKHVLTGLRDGAGWDVEWIPFSLAQVHVDDGDPPVWDQPDRDSGLLALQVGVAVRDNFPERFLDAHEALFDARHAHGRDLRDREVLVQVLTEVGVDAEAVFAHVSAGEALRAVREGHEGAVAGHAAWGVPTFIVGDRAVFVRLMEDPADATDARATVERLIDLMDGWPELNELKATTTTR